MGEQRRSRRAVPLRTVGVTVLVWGPVLGLSACSGAAGPGRAELTFAGPAPAAAAEIRPGDASPTPSDDGPPGSGEQDASPAVPGASSTPQFVAPQKSASAPTTSRRTTKAPRTASTSAPAASRPSSTARGSGAAPGRSTALGTAGSGSPANAAVLTFGPPTPSAAEAEVVRLVNLERTAEGCPALTVSPLLVQVARAHSQEMSRSGGFRHNSPDGRTPFQRLKAARYPYSIATENIAAGQPNAAAVMAAWTSDEESKANMLDCRLTQIGVGVVNRPGSQYVTYWTQNLAAPM
jgi:uncharacterized protein YkwD